LIRLLVLALCVAVLAPTEAAASEAGTINFDKPTKKWYQGPVRYIITKQEVKAYKALETEIERTTFIDWFWQRRDIEPETPANEFRDRFERRALEATRRFSFTTKPGWKTDMGKIYVLIGAPDEINRDEVAKSHRGIITWVYRRPPFPDLAPNTVIAFARDASGEFNISTSPTLDSDVARGLKFSRVKRTVDDRYLLDWRADPVLLDQGVSLTQGELETAIIYGRMMQLPPHEEELFQEFVVTRETYGQIPMESRFDHFKAGDGTTYTTITVGIKSSSVQYRTKRGRDEPDVGVFGKLINKEDPEDAYALASDSTFAESVENVDAGIDELLVFQATGSFNPGSYILVLGVEDRVTRKVSSVRRDVVIPDLSQEALTFSSITLAATMEPLEHPPTNVKPFHLGKFRIVPRPGNLFKQSDELNVYFQIYNPTIDPESGRPRLDVAYIFSSIPVDGGPAQEFGAYQIKDSRAQVQGYAVPMDEWPPGRYEVTIRVQDKVSGEVKSSDAPERFIIKK